MNHSSASPNARPAPWLLDFVILVLALAGFAVNLLLLVRRVTDMDLGIAGCSGGSACEEILASPWSQVFGVPVTVFGLIVYSGVMFSLAHTGQRLFAPLLGVIAGAAVWLVFAQAVLLGKFCPWCMGAHALGAVVVLLGLVRLGMGEGGGTGRVVFWGAVTFFSIGLSQLYGPLPATHQIKAVTAPAVSEPAGIHARGAGRKVSFANGGRTYNVSALPHIGAEEARHVLVEYFDYQCPACQTMSGYISALVAKHPRDVCVIMLPVPLDGGCNRAMVPLDAGHPGSCEYARLALAVWKSYPVGFTEFHEKALKGASRAEARGLADKLIPHEKLDAALSDPWIDELVAANIADWVSFSGETKKLPKLLITGKRILHGLPSGEADFIRVMEQELGL
ncbi:MAG: vitamin K epoxide reductase family protein [Luteolibacter sp.]